MADVALQAEDLTRYRDALNRHAEVMHTYLEPAQVTPYLALGELVRLRAAGVEPVDFRMSDCLSWTASGKRERQSLLTDLAIQLREIGNPAEHPWRGVQLEAILPTDVARLAAEIPPILQRVERLMAATSQLAEISEQPLPETSLDASNVALIGRRISKAPPMDREAISDDLWAKRRTEINELMDLGKVLSVCERSLAETVVDVAWSTDVSKARRDLAAFGSSWFRIFRRDYRNAQATLRGILAGPPPKPLQDRVAILDDLIRGQKALKTIETDPSQQGGDRRRPR